MTRMNLLVHYSIPWLPTPSLEWFIGVAPKTRPRDTITDQKGEWPSASCPFCG